MTLQNYQVVSASDFDELERRVMKLAEEGFLPYEAVQYSSDLRQYWQTMIVGDTAGPAPAPAPTPPPEPDPEEPDPDGDGA